MIYTVTLSPALDYVLRLPELTDKDINRAKKSDIFYGGKGINVSVILTRLGIRNTALGFAAGFTGKELERLLKNDGIETDFVSVSHGMTRINVKIFADKHVDVNAPGSELFPEDIEKLYSKLDKLQEGDVLVLAGTVPASVPLDIYERIMERLQSRGVKFVVDTTGESLKKVLKYRPFLIKPNHHELSELSGIDISADDVDEIVRQASKLQEAGARNVLVSRGGKGATLLDENGGVHSIGIVPGTMINNVGCGDSMVAGFIAGYEKTGNYREALRLGSASGNASAFCEGLAQKEDIENILAKTEK